MMAGVSELLQIEVALPGEVEGEELGDVDGEGEVGGMDGEGEVAVPPYSNAPRSHPPPEPRATPNMS